MQKDLPEGQVFFVLRCRVESFAFKSGGVKQKTTFEKYVVFAFRLSVRRDHCAAIISPDPQNASNEVPPLAGLFYFPRRCESLLSQLCREIKKILLLAEFI